MSTAAPGGTAWWERPLQYLEPLTRHAAAVALAIMAVIVLGQALTKHRTDPGSADEASIIVARALYSGATQAEAEPRERQIRPPGYPLILAAMAYLDPGVAEGLSCAGRPPKGCETGFPFLSVVIIQSLAAVLALVLVYRLALRLSASREIALITLLLAFIWGRFSDFSGNLFAHTWYQLGVVATLYLLIPAGRRLTVGRTLGAGTVAGVTGLIEPTFLVIVPVAALLLAFSHGAAGLRSAGVLIAACALTIVAVLGAAEAMGYDPQGIARHMAWGLAERVAFNRLEGASWWAAILLPIPVFGPLFSLFFSTEIVDSFGYYRPGTYVFDGTTRILPEALAQSGDAWQQFFWLIRTHVVNDLAAYLSSSGALVMRGVWAGGTLIALVGIFQVSAMLRWARIDGQYEMALRVVVLTAALLVAGTLLTSNPMYLNPMLVFLYAYAIAYVAGGR